MSEDVAGRIGQLKLTSKKKKMDVPEKDNMKKENSILCKLFPWLAEFLKLCREAVGSGNLKVLESLLSTFVKHVGASIKPCYRNSERAARLRKIVNDILIYFNMFYQDLKFELNVDNLIYLDLMTELMALYLDLEIKCSKPKEGKDGKSLTLIGQMMTSSLYTFLDHSEDHIIEAILKATLIIKKHGELCAPVLSKILKEGKCFIAHENAYVRYLLAFKLWRKIAQEPEWDRIRRIAETKLNPPPQLIDDIKKMHHILPQTTEMMSKSMTSFWMETEFNFIKAKLEFLKTCSVSSNNFSRSLPDKPFLFGDCFADSIPALSEKDKKGRRYKNSCFEDEDWSGISTPAIGSIGFQSDRLKSRVPELSEIEKGETGFKLKEEDCDDVEFIEVSSKKPTAPVEIITLDSEGEGENGLTEPPRMLKEKNVSRKDKIIKSDVVGKISEKCCLKNKKKRVKTKIRKKVPEVSSKKLSKTREDECSSTKQNEVSSRLRSPEHGVADSTSSHVDSPTDDSFRSPKHQVYEIHSNTSWDDIRTEVASSSEVVDSSQRRSSTDSSKAKNSEISSTRQNSVPSSYSVGSINQLSKSSETYNSEMPASSRKIRVLSPKELRYKSSRTTSESDNTISNSSAADSSSKSFSPVSKSFTFEDKTDADSNLSEKENLAVQRSPYQSVVVSHSAQNSKSEMFASEREKKLIPCDSYSEVGNPYESSQHSKPNDSQRESSKARRPAENLSEYKCVKSKDLSQKAIQKVQRSEVKIANSKTKGENEPKQSSNLFKQKTNEPLIDISKDSISSVETKHTNSFFTSHHLDQFVRNVPKKVEFENVARSYKIVKSNALKKDCTATARSFPRTQVAGSDNNSDRAVGQLNLSSKFVKIKGADLISNSKAVEEVLKASKVPLTEPIGSTQFSGYSKGQSDVNSVNVLDDLIVPEVAQEELVCATSEMESDFQISTSEHEGTAKGSTLSAYPSQRNVSQCVPIIFKKGYEETNPKKVTAAKILPVEAATSTVDVQRLRVVKADNFQVSVEPKKDNFIVIQTDKIAKGSIKQVTHNSLTASPDKGKKNAPIDSNDSFTKVLQAPLQDHLSYDSHLLEKEVEKTRLQPSGKNHIQTNSTNQALCETVDNGLLYFNPYDHPNSSNAMYYSLNEPGSFSIPRPEQAVSSTNLESSLDAYHVEYEHSRRAPNIPVNSNPPYLNLSEASSTQYKHIEGPKSGLPLRDRDSGLMSNFEIPEKGIGLRFEVLNPRQVTDSSDLGSATPSVPLLTESNMDNGERLVLDLCGRSDNIIAGVPRDYVMGERTVAEQRDMEFEEDLKNLGGPWEVNVDNLLDDGDYFLNDQIPFSDDEFLKMLDGGGHNGSRLFVPDLNFDPWNMDYLEEHSSMNVPRVNNTRVCTPMTRPTSEEDEQKSSSVQEKEKSAFAKQETSQVSQRTNRKRKGLPDDEVPPPKLKYVDGYPYHTRSVSQQGVQMSPPRRS